MVQKKKSKSVSREFLEVTDLEIKTPFSPHRNITFIFKSTLKYNSGKKSI